MGFGANGSNERIHELNETAEYHASTVYGKHPSSRLRCVNARHVLLRPSSISGAGFLFGTMGREQFRNRGGNRRGTHFRMCLGVWRET